MRIRAIYAADNDLAAPIDRKRERIARVLPLVERLLRVGRIDGSDHARSHARSLGYAKNQEQELRRSSSTAACRSTTRAASAR